MRRIYNKYAFTGAEFDAQLDPDTRTINIYDNLLFIDGRCVLYNPSSAKFHYEDGTTYGTLKAGTWDEKPDDSNNIYMGFGYFCTDKQTTEGEQDGIPVFYVGESTWVDALGRVVN